MLSIEQQEKWPKFDMTQFSEFWKSVSPRRAFEYRKLILWHEIPDEYLTEEEKNAKKQENIEEIENNDGEINDLRAKYQEKFNTEVPRNKKNNIEWIKNQILA